MTSLPFTNYRTDWQQFCSAQPAAIAAELVALLASTHGNDDEADQQLASLVGRAATDPVMARLVLQRLMPGLLSVAKRRANLAPGTFSEILHDLVANAWIAVCTYPLERRPRKVAANLVRDIEYNTFTQQSRLRRVATDVVADLPERSAARHTNPGEDVITVLADARNAGANPDGLRLLGELAVAGHSVGELAESYGVSPRTILNRRLAAVADLIAHAA
jgi:hypothetical protein